MGFDAEVWEPYRGNKYWRVSIGSWLSYEKALKLKEKAKKYFPNVYLWTFPDN